MTRKKIISKLLPAALMLVFYSHIVAQKTAIRFEHISFEQGLSQNTVSAIIQDKYGYIWLGTNDGLNKYDGYKIKVYRNNPNKPFSLADNYINCLLEDNNGTIWVGTRSEGLCKYDSNTDKFVTIKQDKYNNKSLSDNNVNTIFQDSKNRIWVGTTNGLNLLLNNQKVISGLDNQEKSILDNAVGLEIAYFKTYLDESETPSEIHAITEDPTGNIWVATSRGLYFIDPELQLHFVAHFNKKDINALLYYDSTFWVASDHQFYQSDDGESFIAVENWKTTGRINHIIPDNKQSLWIATDDGLIKYNLTNKNIQIHRNAAASPNSISVNNVQYLFIDRTEILWVGTYLGGVNKWDQTSAGMQLLRHNPYDDNSLSSNQIRAIEEDAQGNLWVGTVDGGATVWDPQNDVFRHYKNKPNDNKSLSHNHVRAIMEAADGKIWLGTDGGGINVYNPKNKQLKHYRYNPGTEKSLSSDRIWDIFQAADNTIWIATFGGGLCMYLESSDDFKAYQRKPGKPGSLTDNNITSVFEDSQSQLWVGTFGGGLEKWDSRSQTFIHHKYSRKNSKSIGSNRIYSIMEDSRGTLWIGTKDGLNKLLPSGHEFVRYTQEDGLPNNVVMGILEDNAQNLWLSTNSGISKFDPDSVLFRNYDIKNGLQSMEFLVGAYFKSKSGQFYFGGINGLNVFYPDSLKNNPYKPQVVITDFKLFNKSVMPGPDSPLKKHISETDTIELNYDQNAFSFDFAALHYSNPQKNRYAYKMEKFDKEMNFTDSERRFATYTNLDPGSYVFKVIGSNSDGMWNNEGVELRIIIHPPIWQTLWFKITVSLIVILSIFFWYRSRIWRIENQKKILEAQVKDRTAQVEAQKTKLMKQAEELTQLSIVASETDNAVMILDATANLQWINDGFTRMFDYNLPQWIQDKGRNLIGPNTTTQVAEKIEECLQTKRTVSYELMVRARNNKSVWVQSTLTPIIDKNHKLSKIIVINTDISKMKQAETEILQQKEEILAQRDDLEQKNTKIAIQNEKIKGSIRYAQTIQQAILPAAAEISKKFDNFIIYKPKDIVSGDFYWYENTGKMQLIAAIDCTGHGVPGAFMSMIGNSLLNEIVIEKGIKDVAEILDNLNNHIIKVLNQIDGENNDGMDVCLCSIEYENNHHAKISFSGAKRPLFIYQTKNRKLTTIKGSRKSIGGLLGRNPKTSFEKQDIVLNEGDILYLTSDGLIDQNNKERKKYGSKQFAELLTQIAEKPLSEQEKTIVNKLQKHTEGTEQRDDITILGIRL